MIQFLLYIQEALSNSLKSFGTVIKIILLSRFNTKFNRIKVSKDKVMILANGPSLKNFEFNKLKHSDYSFLTVNFSPSTELFVEVKPEFHVINAPELWRTNVSDFYIQASEELFNHLATKVTWPLTLFIPFSARKFKKWKQIIAQNTQIKICYYNPTPVEGIPAINHLFYKWNLGMPRPHNVLIPSIMLLMSIKFKEIYLLGADHSWLKEIEVNDNNETLVCQKHFYDENSAKAETMNKLGKGSRKLHEVLHKFYLGFRGYFDIKKYADTRQVKIYNSTKNSFIDAFDRKEV